MTFYIFTFFIIVLLILTNAITDAPNAIATLVGSKVINFKKAALLSAFFNMLGIIVMSYINISVANCISSMVNLKDGFYGIVGLTSGMISVIIFSFVAMKFGIPTSETHGLIAGISAASLALYSLDVINWYEWKNVLIGLFWSVVGTYFISIFITKALDKKLKLIPIKSIKNFQILGCCAMSFMHGAQDGQKFIGVILLFSNILRASNIHVNNILSNNIVVFVAIIMGIGVAIGGKSIVDNVGNNIIKLDNRKALISDISAACTLLFASLTGLPVSTTHIKTMSIVSIGKYYNVDINKFNVYNIFKAWLWTFPVCGLISYFFTKLIQLFLFIRFV